MGRGRWVRLDPITPMTDEPGLRATLEPGPMREWFSDLIAGASLNTPPGWVHLTPVEVSRLHAWLARTPAASDGSLDVAWAAAEAALPEGWVFWDMSRYRNGNVVVRVRLVNAPPSVVPEVYADGSTPAAALNALLARLSERPSEGKTE